MLAAYDSLIACAPGPCNRTSQIYNRNKRQGGEIGRRARLRIAKSPLSKRSSVSTNHRFTREKRDFFTPKVIFTMDEQKHLILAQILVQRCACFLAVCSNLHANFRGFRQVKQSS